MCFKIYICLFWWTKLWYLVNPIPTYNTYSVWRLSVWQSACLPVFLSVFVCQSTCSFSSSSFLSFKFDLELSSKTHVRSSIRRLTTFKPSSNRAREHRLVGKTIWTKVKHASDLTQPVYWPGEKQFVHTGLLLDRKTPRSFIQGGLCKGSNPTS